MNDGNGWGIRLPGLQREIRGHPGIEASREAENMQVLVGLGAEREMQRKRLV